MRKIYNLVGAFLLLAGTSCNVETPPNNALNKGHEDPASVTFIFTPGLLAQPNIAHKSKTEDNTKKLSPKNPFIYADGFSPITSERKSQLDIKVNNEGKVVMNGDIQLKRGQWYKLEILFYNRAGSLINQQFIRNEEQRNMHQFFFVPFTSEDSQNNKVYHKNYIDYKYGDKFDNGTLITPPVGFTGYVKVLNNTPSSFSLYTKLVHLVPPTTKLSRSGLPYHYNEPEKLGTPISDIEVNLTINVVESN